MFTFNLLLVNVWSLTDLEPTHWANIKPELVERVVFTDMQIHLSNVFLMHVHRWRRWANIRPALVYNDMFTGILANTNSS